MESVSGTTGASGSRLTCAGGRCEACAGRQPLRGVAGRQAPPGRGPRLMEGQYERAERWWNPSTACSSLVFSYPTVRTQQSSVPNGVAEVARAFTKLMGAFVTFWDNDAGSKISTERVVRNAQPLRKLLRGRARNLLAQRSRNAVEQLA